MVNLWHKLFLEDRPSIGLSFFRVAVAVTVGFHVIPTLIPLDDVYLHTAFKVLNFNFFTPGALALVQQSPDALVVFFVALFCLSWFCFLIGLFSQASCVVMTLCCYYFYALNSFVIGKLSWDILLVTLFLMCVTPYHGDYFSIDCLRRGDPMAYRRQRPFFLQRLLQMQLAFTFFYTGLYKITAIGNWFTDNPIYYLMKYPDAGVTKYFLIRDFMAAHPGLCYVMGVVIVVTELAMPFLLFCPATRVSAIYLGFIFHVTLILTLDVPAIFFFLFPAQFLLFIHPGSIVEAIERRRRFYGQAPPVLMVYDGKCQFCVASVQPLKVMDLFHRIRWVDYQQYENVKVLHPQLTAEIARSQLHMIDWDGTMYGGFFAFRRLAFLLPMLYPLIPFLYFPGSGIAGPFVYRWIAKNRYLLHFNKRCTDNACFR